MKLKLEISSNNLKTYLTSSETDEASTLIPVTSEQIIELLKEKKLTYGIKKDALEKINNNKKTFLKIK